MAYQGLPKLEAAIIRRDRGAWQRPCVLCDGETVAIVETVLSGPKPVCKDHVLGAELAGYPVRREPLS